MAAPDESRSARRAARSPSDPGAVDFIIGRQIARADIPALCQRARLLLEAVDADRLVCDVGAIVVPDAVDVDALARLQLTARRRGRQVQLVHVSTELRELIGFMGLSAVMSLSARSRLESGRQTEHREETGSIEEERDPADPTA